MEENTNNNDKSKVIMLVSLIIVVSILIVGFVFLAVIDLTRKEAESRLKTTTRRTVVTTSTEVIDSTEPVPDEPVSEPTTVAPTEGVTTTPKTTTTRRQTTAHTTQIITEEYEYTETIIPSHTYEIANDSTTYPDALDSWEWSIVDRINKTRRDSGMSELAVARELRNKAEEAAYIYYANGSEALKKYLEGHSYLYMFSNLNITPETLYDNTVSSTKIVTNPNLKYVGAGVLLKNTSLDTYFYVIIYE